MSDIRTLREELKADLHVLADDTTFNRKIIAAMRFHRDNGLWFSERTFQFTLTAGKSTYKPGEGPPIDLAEIVGLELQIVIGGNESQRESVFRVPPVEFDKRRYEGVQQSIPEIWDFYANTLRLWPIPNSSTDQLYGRYVSNLGIPESRYDAGAGAFKFYAPGGLVQLSTAELDNFTNDWLDQKGAYSMIRARTEYLMYKEFLKDTDGANDALAGWLEQKAALFDESEKRTVGASEIIGCLLDADEDLY